MYEVSVNNEKWKPVDTISDTILKDIPITDELLDKSFIKTSDNLWEITRSNFNIRIRKLNIIKW